MRIATDVMGTLRGRKGAVIEAALKRLIDAGHTVVVWSSDYGLAVSEARQRGFNVETAREKFTRADVARGDEIAFDVALEDDSMQASYLGSKRFIMVHEITTVDELVKNILEGV